MRTPDFTTTCTVDQTPRQVFDAINDVRGWWSGEVEGGTENVGDEFTYRVEGAHYSKQKITQTVPGKKIVWHVLEADLSFDSLEGTVSGLRYRAAGAEEIVSPRRLIGLFWAARGT
jgi:hypothetical protein